MTGAADLVIDTRPGAPRRVGGGLDPQPGDPGSGPVCRQRPPARVRPEPVTPDTATADLDAARAELDAARADLAAATAELDATRSALADLVPDLAGHLDGPGLVRIVAGKLAGHQDCHRLWQPRTVDGAVEVAALILAGLAPADQRAVTARLAQEVGR